MASHVMQSPQSDICQCKKLDCFVKRLATFKKAPENMFNVNVTELAKSGFSYLGKDDNCICYFCKVSISKWNFDDCPYYEHFRHSAMCPHLWKLITKSNMTKKYDTVDT